MNDKDKITRARELEARVLGYQRQGGRIPSDVNDHWERATLHELEGRPHLALVEMNKVVTKLSL